MAPAAVAFSGGTADIIAAVDDINAISTLIPSKIIHAHA